eukprot:jgi/Ulvmu1/10174/UM006_0130.1
MSLLSALPAPKRKAPTVSRWEKDDVAVKEMEQRTLIIQEPAPEPKPSCNPSSHWQMVPKGPDAAAHPHPDQDTIQETMKSTMEALSGIVTKKQAANNPKALSADARPGGPQYIKYTPKTTTQAHNSGVDHRIIQMQEMPKDPLEPPKFRHQKHYRVMKEEVVPLMHSPPKKLTKEEREKFTVPPCVSAWKNAKGYTIPLDKRLAADGRGMQEVTLNKKHMDLSLSLAAAEETARRETELQARLQSEIKQREKAKKEEQLRALAAAARAGAAGTHASLASRLDADAGPGADALPPPPPVGGRGSGDHDAGSQLLPPPPARGRDSAQRGRQRSRSRSRTPDRDGERGRERLTAEEAAAKRERDDIRSERRRERDRELRLAEKNRSARGSKLTRDRDRDVSEKIALGQAAVKRNEVQYDSRLFNREGGVGSGFRGDDNTAVYDKALFADRSAMGMYRARDRLDDEVYGGGGGAGVDTGRFKPDQGFAGTDGGAAERTGPVQFEKRQEVDPFGIDDFLGGYSKK